MKIAPHQWDIFCQVVDNHGDLGVCWRLSQHLIKRGQRVRLFVDQPEALTWMAPQHQDLKALSLLPWPSPNNTHLWRVEKNHPWSTPQCVIEAFACEIPPIYLAHLCSNQGVKRHTEDTSDEAEWVWINLEYLSAEDYPQQQHLMPSPVMHGAAKGKTKWFFYPGFTPQTGGLLKHLDNAEPKEIHPDHQDLAALRWDPEAELKIFLFSYEPQALAQLLLDLSHHQGRVHLKVSPGRSALHVQKTLETREFKDSWVPMPHGRQNIRQLNLEFIDPVDQVSFDSLLASSDLNFVRGEDSWVRAIWAKKPFIWQIYPQDDGVHLQKMNAFLERFHAPESLAKANRIWNGFEASPLPLLDPLLLNEWGQWSQALANQLMAMPDLADQLCDFLVLKLQESDAQKP